MRVLLSVLVLLLAFSFGCKSPKEKALACQKKCKKMKSGFAKRICNGFCERRAYKGIGYSKLASMCRKGDGIACFRAASIDRKKGDMTKGLTHLQAGCDQNIADNCGVLGKIISRGKGVKKDPVKGKKIMEKGCNLGDASSCASPGMRDLKAKKFASAKSFFEKGCKGDAKMSCAMLGVMHRDGKGTPRSVAQARKFMNKSCRLGYKSACRAVRRLR